MSPEQIDARTIDARSDLYSLGLIFYEMLAGEPPFSSASPRELLNLQCTAAAPPFDEEVRKGLPRGVEDMLFSMLEKKAEDRPSSAREVTERLGMFRSAGTGAAAAGTPRKSRSGSTVPTPARDRVSAAPPTPRMANAPASPGVSGDTTHSRRDEPAGGGSSPQINQGGSAAAEKKPLPRTDTIALVEQNARKGRDVPTWLAVVAIIALSLVAGMTTYLIRLKSTSDTPAATSTTSASANGGSGDAKSSKITPDDNGTGGSKR
jgi:serine/threonine protein kinase